MIWGGGGVGRGGELKVIWPLNGGGGYNGKDPEFDLHELKFWTLFHNFLLQNSFCIQYRLKRNAKNDRRCFTDIVI